MGLSTQVESDLKAAMKSRDQLTTSCLRLIRAAFKQQEKDLGRPLEEQEEIQILKSQAKKRVEARDVFRKAGRDELADKEQAELTLIEGYLPAQMDEAAIHAVLNQVFSDLNPQGMKDMGAVMKEAMARLKGAADGKLVNQLVRTHLSSQPS